MSWDYYNQGGIRIKGNSNGYVVFQVTDECDANAANVDIEDPEIFRAIAAACFGAADYLESEKQAAGEKKKGN